LKIKHLQLILTSIFGQLQYFNPEIHITLLLFLFS